MKSPSLYRLLLFALLISCGGCKKQTEVEGETIPKAPACLIATQTTKELVSPSQPSTLDVETITIGTESFQVSTTKKSVYSYDANGRILTEYNTYTEGKSDSVLYQYAVSSVTIRTVNLSVTPKTIQIQVLPLNSQGFSEKQGTLQATYDNDGYLLTLKGEGLTYKISNGNIIETLFADNPAVPSYTIKDEYDLTKSGLPTVQQFYGKASRNLPMEGTVENNAYLGVHPVVYVGTYSYTFDDKGHTTRQIYRGKDGDIPFLYGGSKLTVKDFTYICP